MISHTITVPFVKGKDRPRATRDGRVYTPKKTKDAEAAIAEAWAEQVGETAPKGVPVMVEIAIRRHLPKTAPKKLTAQQDLAKPDIDNVAKLVLDALNGVAYVDDTQVIELHTWKEQRTHKPTDEMDICVTYSKE